MDFVCMCGCVFFLSLRLVVSFHEVIFHPVQTTVILSCDAMFLVCSSFHSLRFRHGRSVQLRGRQINDQKCRPSRLLIRELNGKSCGGEAEGGLWFCRPRCGAPRPPGAGNRWCRREASGEMGSNEPTPDFVGRYQSNYLKILVVQSKSENGSSHCCEGRKLK